MAEDNNQGYDLDVVKITTPPKQMKIFKSVS